MKIFSVLFSRKWLPATVLVIVAMAVCVRLGIWQLDRLEKRRAFNARVQEQIDQPALPLQGDALSADLEEMEYRDVIVTGEYDYSQEVAIRNQVWNNRSGVHLLTPLQITGSDRSVLVDRGWIPQEDFISGDWSKYIEPGTVTVRGVIRRAQAKAEIGRGSDPTPVAGAAQIKAWNFVNIPAIQNQASLADPSGVALPASHSLLPVYIQQAPDPSWNGMPYRSQPDVEITEGPHMGYALQWFSFAILLAIGYPIYIRKQAQRGSKNL